MKVKLSAVAGITGLILAGCTGNNPGPTPTPSPAVTASEEITEAPTVRPEPDATTPPREPSEPNPEPKPQDPAPTTTPAQTPAVEFAQRWGKKYPDVPEFAILKAANGVCRAIEASGANWNDNPLVVAGIEATVSAAGLNGNDGIEFAQDANQNYCSSVSNPT